MNIQSLLDQLLKSGMSAVNSASTGVADARRSGDLGKYGTGAAVGGALGLLLGTRSGRNLGGKALKYGSLAALGALAWKTYQDHQAKQAGSAAPVATGAGTGASAAPTITPVQALPHTAGAGSAAAFPALPAPQIEVHSQAMLKAMIAAAKSDGHMDERERDLVQGEMQRLAADAETRSWVDAELRRPLDPADVAATALAVGSPELAAQVYLASLIVVDDKTTMERAYLDELARQLKLDPALKAELEARASQA
jgi:uncharacterized membrane protein YebE (DUF533 family)